MLSAVFRNRGLKIAEDKDLHDLIRSFETSKSRTPRTPSWNLDVVLKFLTSDKFEPPHLASFRDLTRKCISLLSLATAKRTSELYALDSRVGFEGDSAICSFQTLFLAKNENPSKPWPRSFEVKGLSNLVGEDIEKSLCPVRALKFYLKKKKQLEGCQQSLWCASRKLSGLSKVRAANIIEYRKTKGPFINREQLKSVKGIGPRTFEQCAGFIRILPETLEMEVNRTPQNRKRAEKESPNPLDRTMIHPESYEVAIKFINVVGLRPQDIGSEGFICSIRQFMQAHGLEALAEQCGTTFATMQLIVEGLAQPLDYDIRAQFNKPLFCKGITSIDDVTLGTKLTGTVRNVTHFGAFVDCGLGNDGLVHISKMGHTRLELGNVVEVSVIAVEKERNRISLMLERILN
ncbi:S1 RNA-binding domain-containing protein 1-like [Macrobrachium nipponense]|uniref:S1 RNA-binding domain-containing protein 1-like n=1 Tax=Macrobrachium nipponense TaxID=159736 RepID=UPI0030C7E4B8